MTSAHRRVSVGFQGGQVLAVRVSDEQLDGLQRALAAGGWHTLETEEGPVRLYLGQVVYISADSEDSHVGFG